MASYGFVSNATYGTGMAVAWIAFVRNYGKSPLAAGQWKAFLAFYAGEQRAHICPTALKIVENAVAERDDKQLHCSKGGLSCCRVLDTAELPTPFAVHASSCNGAIL